MTEWTQIDVTLTDLSAMEVLEIIDDALCHGFEFKVENHTIYWRLQ